jgi:hypothetical protein
MANSDKESLRYQLIALTGYRSSQQVNKNVVSIGMRQDKVLSYLLVVVCFRGLEGG